MLVPLSFNVCVRVFVCVCMCVRREKRRHIIYSFCNDHTSAVLMSDIRRHPVPERLFKKVDLLFF